MRGYPQMNRPLFDAVTRRIREAGYVAVSPVEIGDALERKFPTGEKLGGADYLLGDLWELLDCAAMTLLPGWEKSVGARCEAAIAVSLGFAFYDHETLHRIDAPEVIHVRGGYERPVELPDGMVAQ